MPIKFYVVDMHVFYYFNDKKKLENLVVVSELLQ